MMIGSVRAGLVLERRAHRVGILRAELEHVANFNPARR